jgi:hypothetical protein
MKADHSAIGLLGKLFFRGQAPWAQRQKIIVVLWSIVIGFLCGGVVVALVLFANSKH